MKDPSLRPKCEAGVGDSYVGSDGQPVPRCSKRARFYVRKTNRNVIRAWCKEHLHEYATLNDPEFYMFTTLEEYVTHKVMDS